MLVTEELTTLADFRRLERDFATWLKRPVFALGGLAIDEPLIARIFVLLLLSLGATALQGKKYNIEYINIHSIIYAGWTSPSYINILIYLIF